MAVLLLLIHFQPPGGNLVTNKVALYPIQLTSETIRIIVTGDVKIPKS